jgi:hypothetical protein
MKPRIETAGWITFAAIFLIATSLLGQSLATKKFRQRRCKTKVGSSIAHLTKQV